MNICIYGSYSKNQDEKLLNLSTNIAKELCIRNHTLVYGGGKNGLLGQLAKEVHNNNKKIIGVILDDSDMESYVYKECTDLISKKNMSERKHYMEEISDGFIILPGGIGTLNEFFEILVLASKNVLNKPIVLFNTDGFFNEIISFMKMLLNKGMMGEKIFDLFCITDNIKETFDYIENNK